MSTTQSTLHPIFASLAQSFIDAPRLAKQAQLDAYRQLLAAHDWEFQFSDDGSVYDRGRASLANLRMLQRELDPLGNVWNEVAPVGHLLSAAVIAEQTR